MSSKSRANWGWHGVTQEAWDKIFGKQHKGPISECPACNESVDYEKMERELCESLAGEIREEIKELEDRKPKTVEAAVRGCTTIEPLKMPDALDDVLKAMVEEVRKDIDASIIRDLKEDAISGGSYPRTAQIVGPLDNDEEIEDTPSNET